MWDDWESREADSEVRADVTQEIRREVGPGSLATVGLKEGMTRKTQEKSNQQAWPLGMGQK